MSPKDRQKDKTISIRVTEAMDNRIETVAQKYKEITGLKTTKTTVIESALEEGLKIIESRLKNTDSKQ